MEINKISAMNNKTNIPQIRFPEFSGDIIKNTLDSFCEINPSTSDLPKNFVYIDLESVNKGRLEKESYISKDIAPSRAQRVLQKGDVLFQTVRPYQKNNYFFERNGNYVASTGYAQIRTNQSKRFLYHYLHTSNFVSTVLKRCTGSNYPAIGATDLKTIPIFFPSLPEQEKIASFLTAVDERIELLQKKKEKLEEYKKGVMQKLFSQEIRFKDENGNDFPEWEEKRLGEVFKSKRGSGLSKSSLDSNGLYNCILYGELYTVYNEVIYNVVSKTNEEKGVMSKKGDLLIPSSTTTTAVDLANVTALNEFAVRLGGDITILRAKKIINNIFYAYYLTNYKKKDLAKFGQGTTIVHLYFNHFKVMKIDYPSIKEQDKIASFLTSLDDKIDIISKEIEQSNYYKKGLLQKMFV